MRRSRSRSRASSRIARRASRAAERSRARAKIGRVAGSPHVSNSPAHARRLLRHLPRRPDAAVDRLCRDRAARSRRAHRSSCRRRRPAAASPPTTRAIAPTRRRSRRRSSPNSRTATFWSRRRARARDDPDALRRSLRRRSGDARRASTRSPPRRASSPTFLVDEARARERSGPLRRHGHLSRQLRRACARWASRRSRARCSQRCPGSRSTEMAECETCCGFGGTFAVKFGEISARLADNKCGHIAATRRRRGRARRPRLHAEHRGPAAPARRREDAGAARRRGAGGQEPADSGATSTMQVASMHFKERAHVKLNDARLQHNLKKMQGKFVAQSAGVARRARRLRGHARRRQGDPQPRARESRRLARDLRAQRDGARRDGALGRDAGRRQRAGAGDRGQARRQEDHQVEVDGLRGVRARPRDRGGRA